jgi:hypothetical protein
MKPQRRSTTAVLCTLSLCAATAATAAPPRDFYAGASIGAGLIQPEGLDTIDDTRSASIRAGGGVFAGLRLGALPVGDGLPVFAEAGLFRIGSHRVPYKMAASTSELTASGQGVYLAAKLDLWSPGRFAAFVRLGVASTSVRASTPAGQPPIAVAGRGTGLMWGMGVEYDFDSGLALRVDFTAYERTSPRSSAGGPSLSLAYRF